MEGYICPQCGEDAEQLVEGYCQDCTNDNYSNLFRHNFEFNEWNNLSDKERQDRIKTS